MARSEAATVEEYLAELPEDRRTVVSRVRRLILENLPDGYQESMSWGMITYEVPLERYPDTYNGQPLGYLALAAQKNHYALYLMGLYQDPDGKADLEAAFEAAGKRLDMGKSCLKFRTLEDLPLDVIGRVVSGTGPDEFIESYETSRAR